MRAYWMKGRDCDWELVNSLNIPIGLGIMPPMTGHGEIGSHKVLIPDCGSVEAIKTSMVLEVVRLFRDEFTECRIRTILHCEDCSREAMQVDSMGIDLQFREVKTYVCPKCKRAVEVVYES